MASIKSMKLMDSTKSLESMDLTESIKTMMSMESVKSMGSTKSRGAQSVVIHNAFALFFLEELKTPEQSNNCMFDVNRHAH